MTASTKPGDHAARARAASIERIRREIHLYIGPHKKDRPETQDLLAGFEYAGGSAYSDMDVQIRYWLDDRCPHKLPEGLRRPMERLQEFPGTKTARALRAAIARAEAAADKDPASALFATRQELRELSNRCDIWAAEWGDRDAAGRCATRAFKSWTYSATGYAWASAPGWGFLRQWIAFTEASVIAPQEFVDKEPTERIDDLSAIMPIIREIYATLDVVLEAIDAGPIEEEKAEPAEPPAEAAKPTADELLDYDRAGIVKDEPAPVVAASDDAARIAALEEITWAPRLMVLESVEHLPKSGGSGRSDARKDGEPIAGRRLRLRQAGDLADLQAVLDDEFPHLAGLTNRILMTQVGRPWTKLPPLLLIGSPGIAKTRYARRLGEVLDLKPAVHPTTGLPDGMFAGLSRGWSNGMPCAPLQAIIRSKIANPMLIMDEIEKIGTSRSYGSLHDVLLNMLEPESARRYTDVYLNCAVDISAVNFVMTANTLAGIPQPLLDRCTIISVPAPGPEHLEALAGSILADLRRERGQDASWCPDLDGVEMQALREHWAGGSLRVLRQLVAAVLTTRDATAPRQ